MLSTKNVVATAAVKDLNAAKEFYESKLGLKSSETDGKNYITYKSGSTDLLVYQSKFAGGYGATVATWNVGGDIEKIVGELNNAGVRFEHYDMPGMKREGDIHGEGDMKNAWFKDPDGNIFCLVSA